MKPPRKLPKNLTDAELERFLDVADRSPLMQRALAYFLYYGCLRVSEATHLQWRDLEGGRVLVFCGKGSKQRLLPVHRRLASVLDECRTLAGDVDRKAFVFAGETPGAPMTTRTAQRWVLSMCSEAGIVREKSHPHTLRHTGATNNYRRSRDLGRVQRMLGHASPATTAIYTHLLVDDLQEMVDLLD